ncbi:MAG: T9SS type A sorting domain-containing protein [Bacteroidales bacterium]|nr:T9SS type A sorting domain-containing protein [Bacteroidales bacterium]
MKKLLFIILTLFGLTYANSQELVVGGDMEIKGSWLTASPMGGADEATFDFGYSNDVPALGTGGCLAITGFGQTRCLAWQPVTITPGHSYTFEGVYKNSSMDEVANTWFEVILSRNNPDPEADYHPGDGDFIYANNSWMAAPLGNFTGLDDELINVSEFKWIKGSSTGTDTLLTSTKVYISDTVTVTEWYVGIKAGIWADNAGGPPTFIYLFDNISLFDISDGNSIQDAFTNDNLSMVFPSPSDGMITVRSKSVETATFCMYNYLGSPVKSGIVACQEARLDLSRMAKGVYFIKVSTRSTSEIHKVILH